MRTPGDDMALAEGLGHLSALDARQRRACVAAMDARLQEHFSDEAVRRQFWKLALPSSFNDAK